MDKVKGGLSDNMGVKDIAKKHDLTVKDITKELNMGIKVEMEHVDDDKLAKEIAMDHLVEIPDYYTRLKTMEDEAKKELNLEESIQRQFIRKLIRENIELSLTDETPDTMTYDIYYNKRKAGTITCGPAARALGKDTHEIVELYLEEEYTNLNVANQAVKSLWNAKPDINRFVVSVPSNSQPFWEKLGFQRLNDKYHMLLRGH